MKGKKDHESQGETSEYFVLDENHLAAGDIILAGNRDSAFSAAIRVATGADFSHAILCTNPPICVESADFGVVEFNISRFLIRDRAHVKVLRLRGGADVSSAVAAFATRQITREYADRDVLFALVSAIPARQRDRFFCSQLVATAYASAGRPLVPGKPPEKISPGDLARSEVLEDITSAVIRSATLADAVPSRGFLDGSSEEGWYEAGAVQAQKIAAEVRPLVREIGLAADTLPEMLGELLKGARADAQWVGRIDRALANAIITSELLHIGHRYFPPHSEAFFLDLHLIEWIALTEPTDADLEQLLQFHKRVAISREKAVTEASKSCDLWHGAVQQTANGCETFILQLALALESLFIHERTQRANLRCLQAIETIKQYRAQGIAW